MPTFVPPSASATTAGTPPAPPRMIVKSIGPKLRKLLYVVLALLALLIANSAYLMTITAMEWSTGRTYQNFFYLCMFLGHLVLGLLLIVPFLVFCGIHIKNTLGRRNRRAVNVGYALFVASVIVLLSGLALFRVSGFELRQPQARSIAYWAHIISPLFGIWLYVIHRLAGPKIQWKYGVGYLAAVAAAVGVMAVSHSTDPRRWNVAGPKEGEAYFHPSEARTATGNFIPADTLMMDDYCKKCHADVHAQWSVSSHRNSSFNNPMYLASIRETREMALKRDGNVQASRWCAGCHDPVPFFSGAFDDPNYDLQKHPTAHAGLTCTSCHAITHVNSTVGNGDYTIEEPIHYPFAQSDNALLQWVNNQLVKAKPTFHNNTFLKPHHKTEEFCSTCHKVGLPYDVNHYREFVRGQNHYDSYRLSGVSGHGVKSFYYPDVAKTNCAECHMPLVESKDFGARDFGLNGKLSVHDHLFPGANTGLAWVKGHDDAVKRHEQFLVGCSRVDIFGIKEQGQIDGQLHAPLRPTLPTLKPGQSYLLEAVIRTLKMGHHLSQGTVDSNEIWVDVTVTSNGRVIGRSGGLDENQTVDPWSHFINVFMLDENGNRINRRNAQDIRVPLYNHQIPPGAGQAAHYAFSLPEKLEDHVTIEVKLQYRKFDQEYMAFVTQNAKPGDLPIRGHQPGQPYKNPLPIITIARDRLTLPVEGIDKPLTEQKSEIPVWQRWNDYGIGLFLEGRAELKQAEQAFQEVEKLKRFDGPLNLARVYLSEGRLDDATAALNRCRNAQDPPAPEWTAAWFGGLISRQQGNLKDAEAAFRSILDHNDSPERVKRKFNFRRDEDVWIELGGVLFDQARQLRGDDQQSVREALLKESVTTFDEVLKLDSESFRAHYNLNLLYTALGDLPRAEEHHKLHERYKDDDTIRGQAIPIARAQYPAANHAAEPLVIYPLQRSGAPELPTEAAGAGPPPTRTTGSGGEE